jgi:hypothetical protein
VYDMYRWNRPGAGADDAGLGTTTTATRPGGSAQGAGAADAAAPGAARARAANGQRPYPALGGPDSALGGPARRPGHTTARAVNNTRPDGMETATARAAEDTPVETAGLLAAARAVQAALDRRDNGGDASSLSGQ